jgi:transcriptional antiterminator NusG
MKTETTSLITNHSTSGIEGPGEDIRPELVWYAIYVRSRHEFRVQELLTKDRVEAFLPTVERLRRWKDRKKLVTFPLFPGYLFVHIPKNKDSELAVLKTFGVVRFLSVHPGAPEPVPDIQINSLKKIVESKNPLEPYPYLQQGQRVRITNGHLAGVEGILQEKRGQHILVLSVDILQQGASLKVDAFEVEPV